MASWYLLLIIGVVLSEQPSNKIDIETIASVNDQLTAAEIASLLAGDKTVNTSQLNLPSLDLKATVGG